MEPGGSLQSGTVKAVNNNCFKPTQRQWDIMLAVVAGEPRTLISARFSVSYGYISQIAGVFGVGKSKRRSSVTQREGGDSFLFIGSAVIQIDDEVTHAVASHRWHLCREGYAVSGSVGKLHRWLTRANTGQIVDHIDGNKNNCRLANLRIVTVEQSVQNRHASQYSSSIFKGVSRLPDGRWRAAIVANGETHALGHYSNSVNAAIAYDQAARKTHGEFARLNFPEAGEQSALRAGDRDALRAVAVRQEGAAA